MAKKNTATTEATATVDPKANGKANKGKKGKAAEVAKTPRGHKRLEVLAALAKSKDGLTKAEIWEKCKAGSGTLGAGSKDDAGKGGLLAEGLIKRALPEEGVKGLAYTITANGRKELAKLQKASA